MYKWILGCLLLGLGFIPIHGSDFHQKDKIYVPEGHVKLVNNQILIGDGSAWIRAAQLSADEQGYYLSVEQKDFGLFTWDCPKCGATNWFWDGECWVCGRKKPF